MLYEVITDFEVDQLAELVEQAIDLHAEVRERALQDVQLRLEPLQVAAGREIQEPEDGLDVAIDSYNFV